MGNICKGALSTSRGDMAFVIAAQAQNQPSDEAATSSALHTLPVNIIQVAAKSSPCASSLEADSTASGFDSVPWGSDETARVSQDPQSPPSDMCCDTNDHRPDLPDCSSTHNSPETMTQVSNNPKNRRAEIISATLGDSRNTGLNETQVDLVPFAAKHRDTNIDRLPSLRLVPSTPCADGALPRVVTQEENGDMLSRRSPSSGSIETVSLECVETPKRTAGVEFGTDLSANVCGGEFSLKTGKPQRSTTCPDGPTETKVENVSNVCPATEEVAGVPEAASSPDKRHSRKLLRPSPDESPRALVNLLQNLYYGKRNKYRGWSSLRGRPRFRGRSPYYKSNKHRDGLFYMTGESVKSTRLNPHGLGSSVGQNFVPTSSPMVFRLEEETVASETAAQADTPSAERHAPGKDHPDTCGVGLSLDSQRDRLWLSEINAPVHRFPFNIYKGRKQSSQALFPLADFRFDDGIYSGEATPTNTSDINKNNIDTKVGELEAHDKSLASALSIAGRLVKGFSVSKKNVSKECPFGSVFNIQAGTSLNDVYVNVTPSSRFSKDDIRKKKSIDTITSTLPRVRPWEHTTVFENSYILSDFTKARSMNQTVTAEYRRQDICEESSEQMFTPTERSKHSFEEIGFLKVKKSAVANGVFDKIKDTCGSAIHDSSIIDKVSQTPSSNSADRLSTNALPLAATITAHHIPYVCSVSNPWRGALDVRSVEPHLKPRGGLCLPPISGTSGPSNQMDRPRDSPCPQLGRCAQNMHGVVNVLDNMSAGAVTATGASKARPCSGELCLSVSVHTLLAVRGNTVKDCSSKLVYSRHMNNQ
ncbi:hypothetical protein EGW08_013951 [Elysia chlorotica]|uniref:Uncharacterized protein n=1 Tax=Elysia chlorotica TaxID=188477 RepID=A0A3S1B9G6_ELYCH|nr:hypothetical protein EGW08_013951 [Elysia chlorotica]